MNTYFAQRPNQSAIFLACILGSTGYAIMHWTAKGDTALLNNIPFRTLFVMASILLMFDVLNCAQIAKGPSRNLRDPHFWIFAFYMGLSWALFVIVVLWEGADKAALVLTTWGIAGAFFGVFMAYMHNDTRTAYPERYDQTKPATGHALRWVYYMWPVGYIALMIGLIAYSPLKGWSEQYILFQLIFTGSVMPHYGFKSGETLRHLPPRLIGTALLLAGLFI